MGSSRSERGQSAKIPVAVNPSSSKKPLRDFLPESDEGLLARVFLLGAIRPNDRRGTKKKSLFSKKGVPEDFKREALTGSCSRDKFPFIQRDTSKDSYGMGGL